MTGSPARGRRRAPLPSVASRGRPAYTAGTAPPRPLRSSRPLGFSRRSTCGICERIQGRCSRR
eukprot:2589282-Pyramimonas_sp.AAC.1